MQKIKNIEFFRVFLIVIIVLFHMSQQLVKLNTEFFQNMYNSFVYARNGVEAFFIISGFFLILTFKNIQAFEFIKKKYFRLMPMAMFSIVILIIASIFHLTRLNFVGSILSGLLLCNFGRFWCMGNNVALWYTSALFFGLIVFYLITKFAKEKYHIPLFIILGFGSYLLLSLLNDGMYNIHKVTYYGFLSASTLRAFGGIGTGCLIAKFYQKYKDKFVNFQAGWFTTVLLSLTEVACFVFMTWWMCFTHIKADNSVFVLIFSLLLVCFLLNKGLLSRLTDNDISVNWAKYSYALFSIHIPIIRILYNGIIKHHNIFACSHPFVIIISVLAITITASVAAYHLVEKPSYKVLSEKFLN